MIFLTWTIFKVFIEFVTTLLLFSALVFWPQAMWNPSSLTRDRTCIPCSRRRSLNSWTTREVPRVVFKVLTWCAFPTAPLWNSSFSGESSQASLWLCFHRSLMLFQWKEFTNRSRAVLISSGKNFSLKHTEIRTSHPALPFTLKPSCSSSGCG